MSVIWNQKSSNKCTDELKEKASIYIRWFAWEEGKSPITRRGRGLGRLARPGPGIHVWAVSAAREAANRWWSLYFTKAPSWRSKAFVSKWQSECHTGQSLLPVLWGMQPSCGTFWVPGNTELLWHPRLDGWGSLKDGILGTALRVITMDTSSMGEERHPPQMAQGATNIIVGRWWEHGKKTSWMPLGNCGGQTGLQYTHWGIPKITEWDLNGGPQASETWRCEINSTKCGLSPSIGPHCNPKAREIWGNWSSWY